MRKEVFLWLVILAILGGCIPDDSIPEKVVREVKVEQIKAVEAPEDAGQEFVGEAPVQETVVPTAPAKEKAVVELLSYPDAYNGPLYDTSLAVGEENTDYELITANMERNKVMTGLAYFYVDEADASFDLEAIKKIIRKYPGVFVPIFHSEYLKKGEGKFKPEAIRNIFILGNGLLKGLGDLDTYDDQWNGMAPDSKAFMDVYEVLDERGDIVMLHPAENHIRLLANAYTKYPGVTFIHHGLLQTSEKYIRAMVSHENFYLSVAFGDIVPNLDFRGCNLFSHTEPGCPELSSEELLSRMEGKFEVLLKRILSEWRLKIEKHPDRYMWGTELHMRHHDPEVYDLMVKLSRYFIAELPPGVQEKFAYKNGQRVLGDGITLAVP